MKAIMEVQKATYSYPGTTKAALQGLNMRIPAGKKTAICGHNGSGKSTFFLHAIGIHQPQTGRLLWKDTALSYRAQDLKQLRQRVGLVFQDPEQQLILNTPYEDVSYGLRNAGLLEEEIQTRTKRMLQLMGLTHLSDTPIHHLSLGQKKRVALAGVLVLEPELLLLDEPTAYLDRKSEQNLVEELNRIHQQGLSMVMATHDMNLAYAWADWMIVMDKGACVMEGTPDDVFREGDMIVSLGLELPVLYEIWHALPDSLRKGTQPPRNIALFKEMLQSLSVHV